MLNKHITEYLEYYTTLENPEYAVLLKGKWGSGKTYFISEYKKVLEKRKQKYIYVSLYGLTSYDEIETKFLQAIHPKLYNNKTIFAGKIAKGLLKASLKIDLDGDGKTDGNISGQIPNFKPEDLLNTKDYILIFDDLERCSINIIDLLGYINYFVEHQSYKVILIGNEKELERTEKYYKIKEKLIGKGFEFKTDIFSAYDSFINKLKYKSILQQNKNQILDIFEKSESRNLRILRQSLLDFNRLYEVVLKEHSKNNELIKDFLTILFILIFETKKSKSDFFAKLKKDERGYWDSILKERNSDINKKSNKKNLYEKISNRYKVYIERDTILDLDTWKEIVLNSYIKKDVINKSLLESKYYENEPSWKKLWNHIDLDDSNFDEIFNDVISNLKNYSYKNLFHVMLISSTVLKLKKLELVTISQDEIFKILKGQIDFLFENNLINTDYILYKETTIYNHTYNSLGFDVNFEEYTKLRGYIEEKIEEKERDFLKNAFYEISDSINTESTNLYRLLSHSNNMETLYYEKPVFAFFDTNKFANLLIDASGTSQYTFGAIIEKRYEHDIFTEKLKDEFNFIYELKQIIEKEAIQKKGKISGYKLERNLLESFNKAIESIEKYTKSKTK